MSEIFFQIPSIFELYFILKNTKFSWKKLLKYFNSFFTNFWKKKHSNSLLSHAISSTPFLQKIPNPNYPSTSTHSNNIHTETTVDYIPLLSPPSLRHSTNNTIEKVFFIDDHSWFSLHSFRNFRLTAATAQ